MFEPTIKDFLKSGNPAIFIPTIEYDKAEQYIKDALNDLGRYSTEMCLWKISTGAKIQTNGSWAQPNGKVKDGPKDLTATLNYIKHKRDPVVAIFHNVRHYIRNDEVIQAIIDTAMTARLRFSTLIFVGSYLELPPELYNIITFCKLPLPTKDELELQIKKLIKDVGLKKFKDDQLIEKAAIAATGLDSLSAENAIALSLSVSGTLDIEIIQSQKEQEIKKSDSLEYIPPDPGMDDVGGFFNLKNWLLRRKDAFTDDAKEFGLSYPKGILLVGAAGVGKSYVSKAIAKYLEIPLLRFDISRVYSKYVGDSEANIRRALAVMEATAPVVCILDEIDKALSGHKSSADSDAGVTDRIVSTILTWRQETKAPVFLIGTANDPTKLPDMFYRKGRLDGVFWVPLPGPVERTAIFKIHFKKRGRNPDDLMDLRLIDLSHGFTGAEIEACIEDAMYKAFYEKSELKTEHVFQSLQETKPQTNQNEYRMLEEWAEISAVEV